MKESEVRSQNSRSQVTGVRGHDQLSAISPSFQPSFVRNPSFFVADCGLLLKSRPDSSGRYTRCGCGFSSDS